MLSFPVLVGFVVVLVFYLATRWRRKLPPGPRGWPVIGNAFQLDPDNPQTTLTEWAGQYGDVYTINLHGRSVVVANGMDAIHELLVTKSKDFAGMYTL